MQVANLIKQSDQCVMCGLCLPHCPTYGVSQQEGESPRGRISLIKAVANQQLAISPATQSHIQSCTTCLRCQQVCPANVPYAEIIDAGRKLLQPSLDPYTRIIQQFAIRLLTHAWGHKIFRLLQWIARIIRPLGLFKQSAVMQIAQLKSPQVESEVRTNPVTAAKEVTIFPGCTGELLDRETLASVQHLVSVLGYRANLPSQLSCCSALAQHSGFTELAEYQRHRINTTFSPEKNFELISFASGCGQHLETNCLPTAISHSDIHVWLAREKHLQGLTLKPLHKKVLVHMPCSLQTKKTNVDAVMKILDAIPALKIQTFSDQQGCCGAGGMQLLNPQPSNDALLQSMLAVIQENLPDIIVTANIGCALQLRKGLQQLALPIEVVHPITLLKRQLA